MAMYDIICYQCKKRLGGVLRCDIIPNRDGMSSIHSAKRGNDLLAYVLCDECAAKEQAAEDARHEGEEHADL